MRPSASLLDPGLEQLRDGVRIVDLAEVAELDSSLVAAVLAWLREAQRAGRRLELAHPPQGFSTLAQLYGIGDLVPVAEQRTSGNPVGEGVTGEP